jgi:hypothetical protein
VLVLSRAAAMVFAEPAALAAGPIQAAGAITREGSTEALFADSGASRSSSSEVEAVEGDETKEAEQIEGDDGIPDSSGVFSHGRF